MTEPARPSVNEKRPATPRWVKVLLTAAILVVVVVVIVMVASGGQHGPWRHAATLATRSVTALV